MAEFDQMMEQYCEMFNGQFTGGLFNVKNGNITIQNYYDQIKKFTKTHTFLVIPEYNDGLYESFKATVKHYYSMIDYTYGIKDPDRLTDRTNAKKILDEFRQKHPYYLRWEIDTSERLHGNSTYFFG
jgi:hypothetical protein